MRMSPTGRPERIGQPGLPCFEFAVVLFLISLFFVLVTVPIEGSSRVVTWAGDPFAHERGKQAEGEAA